MAKTRKTLLALLVCVFMFAFGAVLFTACSSSSYSVTFMVQDEEGAWRQNGNVAEVNDGSVALPADPSKEYYTFRGWYMTDTFDEGTEFTNSGISSNLTVYAYFVADQVNVYINGDYQGVQLTKDVVNGTYDPGEGLEFDGWYTDENCRVSYRAGDKVTSIYAQSVARITFNNGYEDLYSATVLPGSKFDDPATTVNGGVTLEKSEIVKWYMDGENIVYRDSDGKEIDFSTQIFNINTVIKVEWCTPWVYQKNEETGNYYVSGLRSTGTNAITSDMWASLPAMSVMSEVTYNGEVIQVEAVTAIGLGRLRSVTTVIVNEGIKAIVNSFTGSSYNGGSNIETVILPSSLKVIIGSFKLSPLITDLTLPQGLEVLIDSFYGADKSDTTDGFTISIPSTVINLAAMPVNLSFENNENYYKDADGKIFRKDSEGDILISDPCVVNGILVVSDDIKRIQVGAYNNWGIDYLYLPSSFEVVYNASKYDYRFVPGITALYDYENINAPSGYILPGGAAVFSEIDYISGDVGYTKKDAHVVVNGAAFAESMPETAVVGISDTRGTFVTYKSYPINVVFTGEIEEGGEASVLISYSNWLTGESGTTTLTVTSGEILTTEKVLQAIGVSALGGDAEITATAQFGKEYELGSVVHTNLYIDVVWGYSVYKGFTYTVSNDEATITGFDSDNAHINADTNTAILQIPATITVGERSYTVAAIADNAFADNEVISHVYIPNSVKTIGKSAFKNTPNITVMLIEAGGLEVIGESAFENSGFTSIALPTAKLKEVGPYAFKSQKLTKFTLPAEESDRVLYTTGTGQSSILYEGIEEGDFFVFNTVYLIRFVSSTVESQRDPLNKTYIGVKVYDVQLIAVAGGAKTTSSSNPFVLGYTMRTSTSTFTGATDFAVRFEIMTGSVYYLDNFQRLEFGIISYVHKNAFTDMSSNLTVANKSTNRPTYYLVATSFFEDCWVPLNLLQTIDESLFEDGWWEGLLRSDEGYDEAMAWMTGTWGVFASCVGYYV